MSSIAVEQFIFVLEFFFFYICFLLFSDSRRSPSLDVAVFSSSENNLFVVVEAERANNLFAVASRQTDAVRPVESPAAFGRTGEVHQLKHLAAISLVNYAPNNSQEQNLLL